MTVLQVTLTAFTPLATTRLASQQCLRRQSSIAKAARSTLDTAKMGMDADKAKKGSDTSLLLHPDQFGPIPLPKSASPSSILEFKKCPQSFLLQYLYKLRQPASLATAKGIMCHEALEQIYDLAPANRTLEHLQNLFRVAWGQNRLTDKYRFLFEEDGGEWDIEAERLWGKAGLQLLDNYYQVENPQHVVRPNPMRREIWLHANLTLDPSLGVTGDAAGSDENATTFYMRGIVDRLDMVRTGNRQVALKIVDYKTGKAPDLKYSGAANERIVEEAFYQLKVYALLLREKRAGKHSIAPGTDLRYLELMYLTSESGRALPMQYDLGETQEERDQVLQEVHEDLSNTWKDIVQLVNNQDPTAFVGCSRSFCYCHKCRPRFVAGTLWEPPN